MEDENKTLVVAEATTGDGAAPAATEPEPQTDEADGLDLRKVVVGIYNVWLTEGDNAKRIGTVGRIGSGEWVAYSITGHAGKERYATRRDAADALAAGRR